MNARETHLKNIQDKRDAQQRKAERLPPLCACGKKIHSRAMCESCYSKWRRKNNPEAYEQQKEQRRIYRKEHPEKVKEWKKRWRDKNPDRLREYHQKYLNKNPDKKEQSLQQLEEMKAKKLCQALQKHSEDLKDDPEHLSTEFILDMSEIKTKPINEKQFFCTLHGTTCTPDDDGFGGCGDFVNGCSWVSKEPNRKL